MQYGEAFLRGGFVGSRKDPKITEATLWLCEVTGIKYSSHLGPALGRPRLWGNRRVWGRRPEPSGVALLYLASGEHEAFKPQSELEENALRKMQEDMPQELKKFLEEHGEKIKGAKKKSSTKVEDQLEVKAETQEKTNGYPVIPSPLADAIVAGTAEIRGQVVDINRFVITRDNFAYVGTVLTPAEVEDTIRLAGELARRLRIMMQFLTEERKRILQGQLGIVLNTIDACIDAMKEIKPESVIARFEKAKRGQGEEKKS